MKKLVFLLLFALVAVVTCPDKSSHETAVEKELKEELCKNLGDNDKDDITYFLKSAIGVGLADLVTVSLLEVDNYFVCSVGRIHYDGKDKYISFGILGHVFTFVN